MDRLTKDKIAGPKPPSRAVVVVSNGRQLIIPFAVFFGLAECNHVRPAVMDNDVAGSHFTNCFAIGHVVRFIGTADNADASLFLPLPRFIAPP